MTIINPNDVYGTICFDHWLLNVDRSNDGNNMIEILPDNKVRYIIIDFGHCFTSNNWNESLQNSKEISQLMPIFWFCKENIKQIHRFESWFTAIESMADDHINSVIASVPRGWNLPFKESMLLADVIKYRRNLPRHIITVNRGELGI
jgi:hypothetical protein